MDESSSTSNEETSKIALGDGMLEEIHQKPSLLERLREDLIVINPTTEEEAREKQTAIIDHQSEFPSKIRETIRNVSVEEPADVFLSQVYEAVKAFFFGRPNVDDNADGDNDADDNGDDDEEEESAPKPPFHWWHGLDSTVDSEKEVEVAIRFFPTVLNEKHRDTSPSEIGWHPIYMSLLCSKAMPFIPLLAELGVELGRFKQQERGGLTCFLRNVFTHLVSNIIIRDDLEEEASGKLDQVSTEILMRLHEKGLLRYGDIYEYDLILLSLYRALYNEKFVIEKRIRFMISIDPFSLVECGRNTNLLGHFMRFLCKNNEGKIPPGAFERFQSILELGMSYHPTKLGFVFHGTTLQNACEDFGPEKVKQIIDDEISNTLKKRNKPSLQSLVFEAATNGNISLDGVYTLVRRDPIAILPKKLSTKPEHLPCRPVPMRDADSFVDQIVKTRLSKVNATIAAIAAAGTD